MTAKTFNPCHVAEEIKHSVSTIKMVGGYIKERVSAGYGEGRKRTRCMFPHSFSLRESPLLADECEIFQFGFINLVDKVDRFC